MRIDRTPFRRDDTGVVAIEFALLALPFFMILLAILEVVLILATSMQLEHAVDRVSRRIMTGETKTEQAAIRSDLCSEIVFKISCDTIRIDYREIASVTKFSLPSPVKGGVLDATAFGFTTSATPSFASLRVGYEWPSIIGPFTAYLANSANKSIFVSTALLRFEK